MKYSARVDWLDDRLVARGDWLGSMELAELARLRDVSRRQQWLAGRRIGKQLVCESYGAAMNEVQILTRDEHRRSVKPRVYVGGQQIGWSLSISHSEAGVLAVLATTDKLAVGVDLVGAFPCSPGFQQLWFTARERRWLQQDTQGRATLLWGMKEATYKACNSGESWMPQAIEVLPQADGSFQCLYRGELLRGFSSYAWKLDGQMAVLANIPQVEQELAIATSSTFYPSALASSQEAIESCL